MQVAWNTKTCIRINDLIKTSSCGRFENVRAQDWGILIRGIRAHQKYFLAKLTSLHNFPSENVKKKKLHWDFFSKILNSNKKRGKIILLSTPWQKPSISCIFTTRGEKSDHASFYNQIKNSLISNNKYRWFCGVPNICTAG